PRPWERRSTKLFASTWRRSRRSGRLKTSSPRSGACRNWAAAARAARGSAGTRRMPGGRSFLDTNVFVYTDDRDSPAKQRRALALIEDVLRRRRGVVSTQVLQEYFTTASLKL